MSDPRIPGDTAEEAERRTERAWASLKSTRKDDPDRISKARDAYLLDSSDDEPS